MDDLEKRILKEVAELDSLPVGAFNIRNNGQSEARNSTANIEIESREDGQGINIRIKDGTVNESCHIPVVISKSGHKETVYNEFFIGENCNVTIVAGCGISNCGGHDSQHDGVHSFHVGKNSYVKYIEKHYGEGNGTGKRLMNPTTEVELFEGATMDMDTSQIAGINDTFRITKAKVGAGATLLIHDKILTNEDQTAKAEMIVSLDGEDSKCDIISRGVAKGESEQDVVIDISGNAKCHGHAECDSIIMDKGVIVATPKLKAACVDASLIHEAAIGKIAGEQITKLMTLGLTESQAEAKIIDGFLR
ncbi:MAG: SufD family Fe-S cluster assembly protein [Clostridiales bacterium]|jgi:Fe-S cluster assembly scaffold protein SufB|nr:SufD family Fe-S cluster assembly protein [Clostridiales bacterium]